MMRQTLLTPAPAGRATAAGATEMARRAVDFWLTTEDLPDPDNRIVVGSDGRIIVHWTPNNVEPHRELVRRVKRVVRRAGYPLVFTEPVTVKRTVSPAETRLRASPTNPSASPSSTSTTSSAVCV